MSKKFFRTTVAIPAELWRRMHNVREKVSWSAIACEAFRDKLGEIAERKQQKTLDDVIDRLRKSMHETEDELFRDGYAAGEKWARNSARAIELRRLEAFRVRCGHDWEQLFQADECRAFEIIFRAIQPESGRGRADAANFWGDIVDVSTQPVEDEFIRGFSEGALDVWNVVKHQL
jgi:hypothetical protein